MNAVFQNPMLAPVTDGWPDDALPLQAELEAPAPFPMDALPSRTMRTTSVDKRSSMST